MMKTRCSGQLLNCLLLGLVEAKGTALASADLVIASCLANPHRCMACSAPVLGSGVSASEASLQMDGVLKGLGPKDSRTAGSGPSQARLTAAARLLGEGMLSLPSSHRYTDHLAQNGCRVGITVNLLFSNQDKGGVSVLPRCSRMS